MTKPVVAVQMRGISKSFGGVKALDNVDFEVFVGEVHALLGGNGAGKSTILKVLNGIHKPETGTIQVCDQYLTESHPKEARDAGVAMNFHEMSLITSLSVAQNIFLTREAVSKLNLINDKEAVRQAKALFDTLQVDVDPNAMVGDLGAGQKQLTEIAKAISQNAKVLVLDEPSTALAVSDVERLFVFLRKLKEKGTAIIYVSHRMDEIIQIADRATILRDGIHVISAPISKLPIDKMIEHIVGKRSNGLADVTFSKASKGDLLLELQDVCGRYRPQKVDLKVHEGEIVGLAGLLGSGRSSLARIISGITPAQSGKIKIRGKSVNFRRPGDANAAKVALVPESRSTQGIIADHSVQSNVTMASLKQLTRYGFEIKQKSQSIVDAQIKRLSIKTASRDHAVVTLSGGNQQKVVIGKWLATMPDILVMDEPTAGIDIGSKSEIVALIRNLAREGKAIIMISSELSELLTACDRIVVMEGGRIFSDNPREYYNESSNPNDDPGRQLQAAEKHLQTEIQLAVKAQTRLESTNG